MKANYDEKIYCVCEFKCIINYILIIRTEFQNTDVARFIIDRFRCVNT